VVKGRVTRAFLRSVLPLDDYEVYLCGPPAFMQAMFDILLSLGVSEQRIAYEFFGPFRKLSASLADGQEGQPLPTRPVAGDDDDRALVTFTKSKIARRWDGAHRTLLDFAEAQGLTPAFSCRNGICNTCLSAVEGSVRYIEEPLEDPGPDKALLCCTVPVGPLRIDI
jgi:ferredoxin